jgi:hypothetical protein
MWRQLRGAGVDNLNSPAATVKMHISVDEGIERKITSLAYPLARVKPVTDLSHEDIPGTHFLAAESLHAQTLGIGITSVSAGALSFFMCHEITSSARVVPRAGQAGGFGMHC